MSNGGGMSDLHNEILEELMTIDDAGNGQDEAIDEIINIVREHDKHEHASFALECSEQARADERERCIQIAIKAQIKHQSINGVFSDSGSSIIRAIKAGNAANERIKKLEYMLQVIWSDWSCDEYPEVELLEELILTIEKPSEEGSGA